MGWSAKGEDRIRGYRVYQELERQYNAVLVDLEALRTAVRIKDELIRRLAAEIAMVPNRKELEAGVVDNLHDTAADIYSRNTMIPKATQSSGTVKTVRPGSYSLVDPLVEASVAATEAAHDVPLKPLRKVRTVGE